MIDASTELKIAIANITFDAYELNIITREEARTTFRTMFPSVFGHLAKSEQGTPTVGTFSSPVWDGKSVITLTCDEVRIEPTTKS